MCHGAVPASQHWPDRASRSIPFAQPSAPLPLASPMYPILHPELPGRSCNERGLGSAIAMMSGQGGGDGSPNPGYDVSFLLGIITARGLLLVSNNASLDFPASTPKLTCISSCKAAIAAGTTTRRDFPVGADERRKTIIDKAHSRDTKKRSERSSSTPPRTHT